MFLLENTTIVHMIKLQVIFDIFDKNPDFLALEMLAQCFKNRNVRLLIME